jgi:uncharacterized membrane protein
MKTVITILTSLALVAVAGCESPRGGGISGGEGFKIVVPLMGVTIHQGETKTATVSLDRGEYFKRDVTLDIRASKGISVEPTKALIKASEKSDLTLRITAAKDAALGEYKVFLTGTPATGESTKMEFTVKVVAP